MVDWEKRGAPPSVKNRNCGKGLSKNYKTELENETRKGKSEIPEIKNLQAKWPQLGEFMDYALMGTETKQILGVRVLKSM